MPAEIGTLLYQVVLQLRHVRQRVHMQILVIAEDEDDVWLAVKASMTGIAEGPLICSDNVGPERKAPEDASSKQ